MPQPRRVISCQSCRRLKTRCEVSPGANVCSRYRSLRLQCKLPFDSNDRIQTLPNLDQSSHLGRPELTCSCDCNERLTVLEAANQEMQQMLRILLGRSSGTSAMVSEVGEIGSSVALHPMHSADKPTDFVDTTTPDAIAPVQVIRKMNTWITGAVRDRENCLQLEDSTKELLAEDDLKGQLIRSFKKNTPRLVFIHRDLDDESSSGYSFLTVACMLAGMQGNPSKRNPHLHTSLYSLLKANLSKNMLMSPPGISSIYAMLVICTLNLSMGYSEGYLEAWSISGTLILFLMPHMDSLFSTSGDLMNKAYEKKSVLAWNYACLQHIKFSIGTGRVSSARLDLAGQFIESVVQDSSYRRQDKDVAAELALFLFLYNGVIGQTISARELRAGLQTWRIANEISENLTLRFAFSTAMLIVDRWELVQSQQRNPNLPHTDVQLERHIESNIHHSYSIIKDMGVLMESFGALHIYDFLLGAYAAVTLVELVDHLEDIEKTYSLMAKVQNIRRITCSMEPVFSWATDMMRKRMLDTAQQDLHSGAERSQSFGVWWPPFEALNSTLLSTEESLPVNRC
ncbi:unnamed protein product [Periconia digitata]|uniref:Transcriptional activator of proteases prtT n=1 Tax=Periconia digitata TaxID=1303443 RepID=A0A9W4UHS3_9PLEO|nr:unnamed protein product [Periconia digitata]